VAVTVRGSGGKLSRVTRTLYRSRYGPVLATGWTTTTAYALRDANADNLRSMNEWLAMGKSQNLAQLRAAQDTYQGIPWVNTIAVDASGTAYFADASVVPRVTDAHAARCIDSAVGKALYPETFVLDGSRSTCDWSSDSGTVQPGTFAPSHVPQLTRTDYVANSNQSPWLTNPASPITGYPAIFGDIGTERELRTRLGLDMITRRLAGTDGLGPPGFTLPTLQAAMLSNRNYGADLGRADIVAMCRAHPVLTAGDGTPVDVRAACDILAGWDGRAGVDSRGQALWEKVFFQGDPDTWRVPFDPAHPLTTPRGLNGNDPDVRRDLADAAQLLQRNQAAGTPAARPGSPCPAVPARKAASTSSRPPVRSPARRLGPRAASPRPPPSSARASSWPSS
jgi:acyl-homoserine-lactone acylase